MFDLISCIQKVGLIDKNNGWLLDELNFESVRTVQQQEYKTMDVTPREPLFIANTI
jgi:hypothetical protein